ncbi:putative F-box protein [Raphanus sativus]|nr:putative F-box protein [Raphanus sativus]
MPEFPILCLPIELQALVVRHVAQNSFEDLFRLGATCKSMRSLTNDAEVCASLDMFKYPWRMSGFILRRLLRRCYLEGNPSTLYIKGVEYFYRQDRQEEGLTLIKRATDAGIERALYTYAMTTAAWSGDGYHFCGLRRAYVCEIGKPGNFGTLRIARLKTCVTAASG